MNKPLFSIVTINKDNAAGLKKTVNSVMSQTCGDYEYIVIDGLSTDKSVDIIRQYKDRITSWVSEKDNGVYDAMNKGAARATGTYTLFLNSGDMFASDKTLEEIARLNIDTDFIIGNVLLNYRKKKKGVKLPNRFTFYYLYKYSVYHQATFTKTSVLVELGGYDTRLKLSADWKLLVLALVLYHKTYTVIDNVISEYDVNGISSGKEASLIIGEEKDTVVREYFPYFYTDYIELDRWKRFTVERIRNHMSYCWLKMLQKLHVR